MWQTFDSVGAYQLGTNGVSPALIYRSTTTNHGKSSLTSQAKASTGSVSVSPRRPRPVHDDEEQVIARLREDSVRAGLRQRRSWRAAVARQLRDSAGYFPSRSTISPWA